MKLHLNKLPYGSMKEVAADIATLRYDALHDLLIELSIKLREDAEKDQDKGRLMLAGHLVQASLDILRAAVDIKMAWSVCEKHMREEK